MRPILILASEFQGTKKLIEFTDMKSLRKLEEKKVTVKNSQLKKEANNFK